MYVPSSFRIEDPARLADFIRQHGFATLVTSDGAAPLASHLPLQFHAQTGANGTLVGHMARANPQWKHFASGREVLAIFQGPHAYVSPAWYATAPAVPTWNYTAVHAYGVPSLITDHARIVGLLSEIVAAYESTRDKPWPGDLHEEYRDKMIQGIVAFEIALTLVEAKFKLSQNRPLADVQGVIDALLNSNDAGSVAVARLMQEEAAARES
jgi:transcriptional regulator